jgi:hypothetical protein
MSLDHKAFKIKKENVKKKTLKLVLVLTLNITCLLLMLKIEGPKYLTIDLKIKWVYHL